MADRNRKIDQYINRTKENLEYQQIQKEFAEKKGNEEDVKRFQEKINEYKKDIEIWESLKDE